MWQRLPWLGEPQTITLRESGIEEELAHAHATIDWDHWTHAVRVDGAWLLRSPSGYVIIPIRALGGPNDEATLRRLAGYRVCSKRWLPF